MTHPVAIYRFSHPINPKTGKPGTRWDYESHEGRDYPELVYTLKRDGARVLYLNKVAGEKKTGKPVLGLFRGKGESLSGVFEPDIKRPGLGFGDLGDRANAALLIRRDEQADTLTIMVFPELRNQAAVLFTRWGMGEVAESISSNNLSILPKSVQGLQCD